MIRRTFIRILKKRVTAL